MTDHTAAARQRRSRAHRRGDHSICLPERCKAAAAAELVADKLDQAAVDVGEDLAAVPVTGELGPRGRQLWADMSSLQLGPAHRVLLHEACRTADRLDRLDLMLANRGDWIEATVLDLGNSQHIRVTVDGMLSEARQQALALRSIVGELRQALGAVNSPPKPSAAAAAAAAPPGSSGPPGKGSGAIGDLSARIAAARSRAPAG